MDWLTGSPIDAWLPRRSDFPLIGPYFFVPEVVWFVSYSGLFLDLFALPLLLIRKTRPWMALALVFFHFTNDQLFSIGIFPWFMIATLTIFLPPSWPGDLYRYLYDKTINLELFLISAGLTGAYIGAWFHGGISTVPFFIAFMITVILIWDFHKKPSAEKNKISFAEHTTINKIITIGLALWVSIQILLPMRHFVIEGNPSWTEEGHRFAWHMKLRSESCNEQFYFEDSTTGEKVEVNGMPYLESWQRSKVSARPQLVIQYASFLNEINQGESVFADIECSLNGAPRRRLIDPDVDLTQVQFKDWKKNDWILR
jgi:vitamin K-dependent gamma-carboxylase